MSDVELGDVGGEDPQEEKRRRKKKNHRTPEEKEDRRRQKEASEGGGGGGGGDDADDGNGEDEENLDEKSFSPAKGPKSFGVSTKSPSARSEMSSKSAKEPREEDGEDGDDEPHVSGVSKKSMTTSRKSKKGYLNRTRALLNSSIAFVKTGLYKVGVLAKPIDPNDGYTGEVWVKPSRAVAKKHARDTNVMQIRAGINVYMDNPALEPFDGDEIFAEIYAQCERKGISINKVVKTGPFTATIEDVALSSAGDLEQQGVLIAGIRVTCVKEQLSSELEGDDDDKVGGKTKGAKKKEGEDRDVEANFIHPDLIRPYNLRSTGPNELGELGVGIGLYFHSLLWGARVLGLLSVVGCFTLITYLLAGLSSAQIDSESLTWFAIPTLGAVIWTEENASGLFLGKSMNKTVMLIITSVECLMAIGFIYLVKKMKRDQSVAIDAMDVSNISLQDYAVKVDYLPRDVTAEELGTFFSKFGKVHQVTLGTDVSGVIGKHRRRGEMVNTREELGAKFAKSRGKNFIVGEQIRVHDKAMQQLEKALVEATNNTRAGRGNRVTSAFVTFETEDSRKACEKKMKPGSTMAWLFRRKKYKFRETYRLWINRAPEASDILWENLAVDGAVGATRRFFSWIFMTILLVCTCAMVVLAESAQSTVPPAIACDAPAASGALDCDAIWPAVNATGQNSSLILLEVREMMDQVDAVTCVEYVSGGQWKGTDLNTYDGVSRIDSESWYNADGTWAGGFDANTLRDECSAMACFDCFCKTRVASLVLIGVGFTEDTDGYYALCETYFAGQFYGVATSGFTAVLNIALGTFTRVFSNFEKHHTKSGLESSVSVKLFLALVVNSALIPVLVFAKISKFDFIPYLFAGPYEDFVVDWYQTVSSTLSTTLVVNACVFPLTALGYAGWASLKRVLFAGSCVTQRQLNNLHSGSSFDLSERYAQLLAMMFVAICFQAAMPALVPVTAGFCLVAYHEAKYTLLRHSKKPPAYDETMARFFWAFAPSAAFCKLFVTLWMVSAEGVPSFGATVEPLVDVLEPISETSGQFSFATRFTTLNGAVAFFTTLIVVLLTVLNQNRVFVMKFVSKFGASFVMQTGTDEDELSNNVPDISIALSDGILKGLAGYMIASNPEYNAFVPPSATIGAGGLNQPKPAEWEAVMQSMSAAEEERMRVEMKKMTATFVEEAGVEYGGDMGNVLKKKKKTKRGGKVAPEEEDSGFLGNKPQLNSKESFVAPLAWGDETTETTTEVTETTEETAGDGNNSDAGETLEEKAERRRRRKERKERKKKERDE